MWKEISNFHLHAVSKDKEQPIDGPQLSLTCIHCNYPSYVPPAQMVYFVLIANILALPQSQAVVTHMIKDYNYRKVNLFFLAAMLGEDLMSWWVWLAVVSANKLFQSH